MHSIASTKEPCLQFCCVAQGRYKRVQASVAQASRRVRFYVEKICLRQIQPFPAALV